MHWPTFKGALSTAENPRRLISVAGMVLRAAALVVRMGLLYPKPFITASLKTRMGQTSGVGNFFNCALLSLVRQPSFAQRDQTISTIHTPYASPLTHILPQPGLTSDYEKAHDGVHYS